MTRWLASLPARHLLKGPKHVVCDVAVHLVRRPDESDSLLNRLTDALKLLEEIDPNHYRRLLRNRCRILVLDGAYAHYLCSVNVIVLGPSLILEESVEELAATLVHEATHARIHQWARYSPRTQRRIERLCLEQELVFFERLAAAGRARTMVSYLRRRHRRLENLVPTRAERLSRLDAHLRANAVPRWARAITVAVGRALWSRWE